MKKKNEEKERTKSRNQIRNTKKIHIDKHKLHQAINTKNSRGLTSYPKNQRE
jgi:hypothetical protein